jgi:hypothetical protein
MLAFYLGRMCNMCFEDCELFLQALSDLPSIVENGLAQSDVIAKLLKNMHIAMTCFSLAGRG